MSSLTSVVIACVLAASAGAGNDLSFDKFGGWKAIRFEPGRFFRTHHDGQRWWLVTPEGHAFLSIGVGTIHSRGERGRVSRRRPYHESVLAKHGNLDAWATSTRNRLRQWGFNTVAGWSSDEVRDMPRTIVLSLSSGMAKSWMPGGLPDVFEPAFVEHVRRRAERCRESRDDPWLVGYFLDNELSWGRDWRAEPNLFDRYARLPAEASGKLAWCRFLQDRYKTCEALRQTWDRPIETWEELRDVRRLAPHDGKADAAQADRQAFVLHAARQYFRVCTEAIRAHDPNHLILGCRFVHWVAPRMVVKACGEFCDVVSVNLYELGPASEVLYLRWRAGSDYANHRPDLRVFHELSGKPLMITEFSFRSMDSGLPNTYPPPIAIQPTVATQQIRAERYAKYVQLWMCRPYFVGYHWFQWADQPKEGRGDGENGNYGLVTIRDEPYAPFVERVARMNVKVWTLHAGVPASRP
ncbi:MAG: beta-agarase [Phycisphaerae bacterium]|nr:beta-agarase [Phycisphaerae bacterium]